MGILPKKSWHVYKETNREIVRHDEEQEQIQKELTAQRAEQSEREERLNLLRNLAKRNNGNKGNNDSSIPLSSIQNEKIGKTASIPAKAGTKSDGGKIENPGHFSLFNEYDLEVLGRRTDTQKSIQDREIQDEPFKFFLNPKINKDPWYASSIDERGKDFHDQTGSFNSLLNLNSKSNLAYQRDEQYKKSQDPLFQFAKYEQVEKLKTREMEKNEIESNSSFIHSINSSSHPYSHFPNSVFKIKKLKGEFDENSIEKTKDQLRSERMSREKREKLLTMKLLENERERESSNLLSIRKKDREMEKFYNGKKRYDSQYL